MTGLFIKFEEVQKIKDSKMSRILRLPNACLDEVIPLVRENYQEAYLQGNYLCSLNGLPQSLVRLDIQGNNIDEEGFFFPFPHLEELNIQHNRLNIGFTDDFILCFPSLKRLNMCNNKLKEIGFLRDSIVEELSVRANHIRILSALPLTLKILMADLNNITMIQSRLPPALEFLDGSYNSLRYSSLPFTWPTTLRELHLNHNQIERFPRKLPDSLEILSLSCNRLTSIPQELPKSLRILNLNFNRLRHFPDFTNHRFYMLYLNSNCLTTLPKVSIAKFVTQEENWNTTEHHKYQRMIAKCWKRYVFTLRLRHFKRTRATQEELFMVSMMPERWEQIDTIDPVWFRKDPSRNRIDPH